MKRQSCRFQRDHRLQPDDIEELRAPNWPMDRDRVRHGSSGRSYEGLGQVMTGHMVADCFHRD